MKYVIFIILGVLTWPVLEYLLHRYLGHELSLETLFKKEHLTHHRVRNFFAPAIYKVSFAILVLGGITLLGYFLNLKTEINFYVGGILGMYLFYEWLHYIFHTRAPKTKIGSLLRKHHFSHHFRNAHSNYGVTNTFFDKVFGTYKEHGQVYVPKSFMLDWLVDENGAVKPEYQSDYRV